MVGQYNIIFTNFSKLQNSSKLRQPTGIKSTPSSNRLSSWIYSRSRATISLYPPCGPSLCPTGYSPASQYLMCTGLSNTCTYTCINSNGYYYETTCSM